MPPQSTPIHPNPPQSWCRGAGWRREPARRLNSGGGPRQPWRPRGGCGPPEPGAGVYGMCDVCVVYVPVWLIRVGGGLGW